MLKNEYPILEFDEDRNAFIRPEKLIQPIEISEKAVICFLPMQLKKSLRNTPKK